MKHDDLVKAVQTLTATVEALSEEVSGMREHQDGQNDILIGLQGMQTEFDALRTSFAEQIDQALGAVNGFEEPEDGVPEDETDEQRATRVGLLLRVTEIEALIKGRNRSAPVKRNMTDADAMACLVGDFRDLDHKEAGESMGLTYAQVYSCRLEYTFKHIHQRLRQNGIQEADGTKMPWKNPWAKK